MFNAIRHSTHRLRLWLIAAAAILLVTSVLEAGHGHGAVTEADDHCVLCQHSVSLDKIFINSAHCISFFSLAVFVTTLTPSIIPNLNINIAQIRAPPANLQLN